MNITLSTTPSNVNNTPDSNSVEAIFKKRWSQIKREERLLEKDKQQRKPIVARFERDVRPLEEAVNKAYVNLFYKLDSFWSRKTLSDGYKQDTLAWQAEIIDILSETPFKVDSDISEMRVTVMNKAKDYERIKPEDIEMFKAAIESEFEIDISWSDEEIEALMLDPRELEAALKKLREQYIFDKVNAEEENVQSSFFDDEDEPFENLSDDNGYFSGVDKDNTAQERLISKNIINKCYRKLAYILHPDRAENSEERENNHHLMAELSIAKKKQDVYTIFNLYGKYVDDPDFVFSEEEFNKVNELLLDKLRSIQQKRYEVKNGHDFEAWIFSEFKGRSKKLTDQNFDEYIHFMEDKKWALEDLVDDLTSVKSLKEHIKERKMFMFDDFAHALPDEILGSLFQ